MKILVTMLVVDLVGFGQTLQSLDALSDHEVKLALSEKGKDRLVVTQDMGLMAAQGNQVPTITLYMPEAVLAIRAESAKKQFTRYPLHI